MNLAFALIVVLAQVESGGMAMQDPRQMSGIPRADEAVPGGTLTVRVVRGDLGAPAPPGQVVHLVGLAADGKVSLDSKTVADPQGRVTFSNLDREGRIAYYALTLIGGDRLESQVVQLPPEVGVRVMLVGRKVGPDGQPVGAAIDDRTGGQGEVPAGEVWVSITGRAPRQVELLRLGPSGAERIGMAPAEPLADGATFAAKLSPGAGETDPNAVYFVATELEGRRFLSTPFMRREGAGTGAFLFTYEGVFFGIHTAGELDDERYWLESQFRILNPHAAPYVPGPDGFLMPLPLGFESARVKEEHLVPRTKMVPESGIIWMGPVPPGRLAITVQWAHSATDGAVDISWPMPHGLMDGTLILAHYPGAAVSSPGGAEKRQVPLGNGRLYDVLSGLNRKSGESLVFQITGLPQHPKSTHRARLAVGALVLIVLGWTIFAAIGGKPAAPGVPPKAEEPAVRRKSLDEEKERLYTSLVDLEKRRRAEDVEDSEYRRERLEVVSRLVLVHRELDQLRAEEAVSSTSRRKP